VGHRLLPVIVGVGLAAVGVAWLFGRGPAPAPPSAGTPPAEDAEAERRAALRTREPEMRAFCTACHAWTPPEVLPADAWAKKVYKMYDLANHRLLESRKRPLRTMKPEEVIDWFQGLAPDRLDAPPFASAGAKASVAFASTTRRPAEALRAPPGIADVLLEDVFEDLPGPEVIACDMISGRVLWGRPGEAEAPLEVVAALKAPARARAADLDGDGRRDLLVADLGSSMPVDDPCGKVVWLRRTGERTFEARTILEGVGRVADARAADLDGDGDLDVVAAVFGWYTTGGARILWNRGPGADGLPRFEAELLEERNGAMNAPLVDVDGDGRVDVVLLISQEHECVVVHRNLGGGKFVEEEVFTAPHPHFGASNLAVADVDGDGDRDMVLVNGDSLDDSVQWKPWQGVTYLENRGAFPFEARFLGPYYGVHGVDVADLDGDGDLDLVASSFLPRGEGRDPGAPATPGIAWWEQTAPGKFTARVLDDGPCVHASVRAGDLDGDGRTDLLAGTLRLDEAASEDRPPLLRVHLLRKP
jgi:hypothetical protein